MTCASIASDLVDLARGLSPDAERARAIERHVRDCADCAARLDRERALSADMRRLADDTLAPPLDPTQEAAVLAAFDTAQMRSFGRSPKGSRSFLKRASAAVCVSGAVAAAIAWMLVRTSTTVARDDGGPLPSGSAPPSIGLIVEPPAVGSNVPSALAPHRRGNLAAPTTPIESTRFVLWPGADDLPTFESGHLVRMQLPATVVASMGLTPTSHVDVVEADVLVDQGGFARAVRLVP